MYTLSEGERSVMSEPDTTIRCSRCILPENFPQLELDDTRLCKKCREYDTKYARKDYSSLHAELERIVSWAKNQHKRFDCVIPFSGGKDSSYSLYYAKERLGLKVLAVNFNNGLRTTAALKNIEKIIHRLDVAYVCYGPNWSLMRRLYREFFLKTGQFCFPCDMGIWATVHRVAEQYDVPLIFSGYSAQIEGRHAHIYSYNNNLFKNIVGAIASKAELKDFLAENKMKKMGRRLKHMRLTRYRRQISLPDYVVWDDNDLKDVITNKLEWEKNSDGSSDHIDCLFAPIKNYLMVTKWGFGEKTTKYAAMVRSGELERNEALRKALADDNKDCSTVLKRFQDALNLTPQDLKAACGKSHLPYL